MQTIDKQKIERIKELCKLLPNLTNRQINYVESVVNQLCRPYLDTYLNPESDFVDQCVLNNLGDSIRIHHCFSNGPFTKDKFEYAMHAVLNYCGVSAELAPSGNPGYDIKFNNQKVSLKTEAEAKINRNKIHVSKMMELGKGEWVLEELRRQFLRNLQNYDRILTLRCLSKKPEHFHYELVEIPKLLLEESIDGSLRTMNLSKQTPKPGYCDVKDSEGLLKYQLYFDAGGERKLQIKNLDVRFCIIQAIWKFSTIE